MWAVIIIYEKGKKKEKEGVIRLIISSSFFPFVVSFLDIRMWVCEWDCCFFFFFTFPFF